MSRDHTIVGQEVRLRVSFKPKEGLDGIDRPNPYSITGQAVNLVPQFRLKADQGTYSKTGQAAALATHFPPAQQGSYAYAGQVVDLQANLPSIVFSVDQGTYSHRRGGGPPEQTVLIGSQGKYIVSGQTPVFTDSGAGIHIDIERGIFTSTGQANFILNGPIEWGAYAYIGQDIGEPLQKFKVTQGVYQSTGQEATFTGGPAEEGIGEFYQHHGQDAYFQTLLFIEQATYQVTGQEFPFEVVGQEAILDAQQGTYTLTGQDAGPKNEIVGGEQGTYTYLAQDALLTISLITEQGEYNYTPYLFLGDADETSYSIAGQDVVLRIFRKPVISQVGDDYPWKGKETKDSARRRQSWREQDEARASLKRAVTDAIEGLEDRKDREAAKTLRQVRGRYLDDGGLLDFRRMLEDELKPIRKLLTEYAGRDYAQKVIQGYQAQIDKTRKEEETEEQELTKLLKAYQLHEKEQVQAVSQAMKNFTKLMERTTKNATKVRPGRN